jgi:hypothetical protein
LISRPRSSPMRQPVEAARIKIIRYFGLLTFANSAIVSAVIDSLRCFDVSTIGRSNLFASHLRGYRGLPSASSAFDNGCGHAKVGVDCPSGEPSSIHLRYESLHCRIFCRFIQGKMSYLGQDPLVRGGLNGWNRRSADRFAIPGLRLFEPDFGPFFERDAELLFDNARETSRRASFEKCDFSNAVFSVSGH